jgi:hypothetical protein
MAAWSGEFSYEQFVMLPDNQRTGVINDTRVVVVIAGFCPPVNAL